MRSTGPFRECPADWYVFHANDSVTVYSTTWCPWCDRAKALLNARGIAFDDVNIETQPDFRRSSSI